MGISRFQYWTHTHHKIYHILIFNDLLILIWYSYYLKISWYLAILHEYMLTLTFSVAMYLVHCSKTKFRKKKEKTNQKGSLMNILWSKWFAYYLSKLKVRQLFLFKQSHLGIELGLIKKPVWIVLRYQSTSQNQIHLYKPVNSRCWRAQGIKCSFPQALLIGLI